MEKLKFRFPLIDYHVHLVDDFGIDQAVELAQKRNVKFGILDHPGPQHKIENDSDFNYCIRMARACDLTEKDMLFIEKN